jgi:putative intracellular protease/amidase
MSCPGRHDTGRRGGTGIRSVLTGGTGSGGPACARATGMRTGMVGNMALVVDGNLISARTPADLGPWMKALLKALAIG